MPAEIDELLIIARHNLLADPIVAEIVEFRRVFTDHGVDPDEPTRKFPCLILELQSGFEWRSAPVGRRVVHIWAYSNEGAGKSRQLYKAAKNVLQRKGLGAPLDHQGVPCFEQCVYFEELNGVRSGWNENVAAHFTRGSWVAWQFG